MKTENLTEWKTTPFSVVIKRQIADLPICLSLLLVMYAANDVAKNNLDSASYSSLSTSFDNVMNYLGIGLLGFMFLLSAVGVSCVIFERISIKRRPWSHSLRFGGLCLLSTVAFGWLLLHM